MSVDLPVHMMRFSWFNRFVGIWHSLGLHTISWIVSDAPVIDYYITGQGVGIYLGITLPDRQNPVELNLGVFSLVPMTGHHHHYFTNREGDFPVMDSKH